MNTRTSLLLSSILTVALLFFAACGNGGGGSSEDEPEYVRFVNALVDEDSVEVSLGEENPQQAVVKYGRDSGYLSAPEGDDIPVRVRKSSSVLPSISDSLSIESGKSYSYYIVKSGSEVVGTLLEDTDELKDNTIINARIFNAISSGAVDLYITFKDQDLEDVDPVISGAKFNGASDLVAFDEGSYTVSITNVGSKEALASANHADFSGGKTYTIVARENKDGGDPYSLDVLEHHS